MNLFQAFIALALLVAVPSKIHAVNYDPLAVNSETNITQLELTVHDSARDRDLPVHVYLSTYSGPAPVIMFSHGLGGSRYGSAFLGKHWALRGYVVVFLQHPGSDDSVWKNAAETQRMGALRGAASLKNFQLRVQDVSSVFDQMETWNKDKTSSLFGRLDMQKVGMSGHSFGAVTTQAVSGESFPLNGHNLNNSRIKAAVIMSPSSSIGSQEQAFGDVKTPWMLMTGTRDVSPIGNQDATSRLMVYPALHGSPKYELVLNNAEHSVFTDRALPGDREPRNPNHHRVILALSTAFWDAYLKGDPIALDWLKGPVPRSLMEKEDRWQFSDR